MLVCLTDGENDSSTKGLTFPVPYLMKRKYTAIPYRARTGFSLCSFPCEKNYTGKTLFSLHGWVCSIIIGTSDTWWMSHFSHRTSVLYFRLTGLWWWFEIWVKLLKNEKKCSPLPPSSNGPESYSKWMHLYFHSFRKYLHMYCIQKRNKSRLQADQSFDHQLTQYINDALILNLDSRLIVS